MNGNRFPKQFYTRNWLKWGKQRKLDGKRNILKNPDIMQNSLVEKLAPEHLEEIAVHKVMRFSTESFYE